MMIEFENLKTRCAQQRHPALASTAANMENPAHAGFAPLMSAAR
jgi:hypothetical protein